MNRTSWRTPSAALLLGLLLGLSGQAMGQGADPIDAVLYGAYFETDDACEKRAFQAYPLQNDLTVPSEAHFQLFIFAERS